MLRTQVLRKTPKGVDEMKYRTFGLHQSVRSLLIIIDGVSTVEKLLGYTAQLHDAEETLSWLIQEGFVE